MSASILLQRIGQALLVGVLVDYLYRVMLKRGPRLLLRRLRLIAKT